MQWDLRLGAAVFLADDPEDQVGTLTRVLVDDAEAVEELVVRLDGGVEELLDDEREVRVPAAWARAATEAGVVLQASRDALEECPDYLEERPPQPEDRWVPPPGFTVSDLLGRLSLLLGGGAAQPPLVAEHERPPDEHQIALHAAVLADGERLGEVTRVLYEPAGGRVKALVLETESGGPQRLLPAERVLAVAEDGVEVRLSRAELAGLEPFRP